MKPIFRYVWIAVLLSACSLGKGYYGPFELVVKAKDGEQVEDIIIALSKVIPSGESLGHTYKEILVTSTDEVVTFPRGYVSDYPQNTQRMDYSILHPFYKQVAPVSMDFSTANDGTIRFPDVQIEPLRSHFENQVPRVRTGSFGDRVVNDQAGDSVRGRTLVFKERYAFDVAETGYFVYAAKIGRRDLVEKYLQIMVQRVTVEEGLNKEQEVVLENDFRRRVGRIAAGQ